VNNADVAIACALQVTVRKKKFFVIKFVGGELCGKYTPGEPQLREFTCNHAWNWMNLLSTPEHQPVMPFSNTLRE